MHFSPLSIAATIRDVCDERWWVSPSAEMPVSRGGGNPGHRSRGVLCLGLPSRAHAHPAKRASEPERRINGLGLMTAGLGLFALNYTILVIVAGARERQNESFLRPLFIPAVGPWMMVARSDNLGGRFAFSFLGVLTTGLLATGIVGSVLFGQERHRVRHGRQRWRVDVDTSGFRLRF